MEHNRTERLFDLLGDIDDALIAAAAPKPVAAPKKPRMWKKWVGAVACLCLAGIIGTVAWRMNDTVGTELPNEPKYPPAETVATASQGETELHAAFPIIVRTTAEIYPAFAVNGNSYTCHNTNRKISPTLLSDRLGDAVANTTSQNDSHKITYYRIQGISEQCAVAVIFEGEEDIYVYASNDYTPKTMADLFADMSLSEYLIFDDPTVTVTEARGEMLYTTTYLPATDLVIPYLLTDMMSAEIHTINGNSANVKPASLPERITVRGHMNMFGDYHIKIWISRNGYLVVPLFGRNYIFTMSDEQIDRFLEVLAQHDSDPEQTVEEIPPGGDTSDNKTMADTYSRVMLNGITYYCHTSLYGIDGDLVGEQLGEMKAANSISAPTITYYRLVGVAQECGIAVRFPDDDVFYSYYNHDYRPETLGDLIEDMGLSLYLRQGNPTAVYREGTVTQTGVFSDTDPDLLWQYLLTNTSAENVALQGSHKPSEEIVRIRIPIRIPLFSGSTEYTIWVTEDGYLRTDLLDIYCVFALEPDAMQTERYLIEMILRYPDKLQLSVTDSSLSFTLLFPKEQVGDDAPLNLRYRSLETDGITYITTGQTVDAAEIGAQLGSTVALQADEDTALIRRTPITYYAIEGTSLLQAVAIRFTEGDDTNYYRYHARHYTFDTLGELLTTADWQENLMPLEFYASVRGIFNSRARLTFFDVDTAQLNKLFTVTNAPNVYKSDRIYAEGSSIGIRAELKLSDGSTVPISLGVSELGYLSMTIDGDFNRLLCFHIGEQRARAFIDYIRTECIDNASVTIGNIVRYANETVEDAYTRVLNNKFTYDDTAE